jgi:alpha-galactosidase
MDKEAGDDAAKKNAMMQAAYEKMHQALIKAGRPMVYSLCQYGWDAVWEWGPQVDGNLWRTTGDISDNYDRMSVIGFAQAGLEKFAGPGHWNDPDMLEVGNGKMTGDEYRTHMSLWAMLAAPLLAGNDLSKMTDETKSILMNRDVIAIDQDALGIQGTRDGALGPEEVWSKPLKDGLAIALFNRGESALPMTLSLKKGSVTADLAHVDDGRGGGTASTLMWNDAKLNTGATIKNVWTGETMTLPMTKTWMIPQHGVVLLVVGK